MGIEIERKFLVKEKKWKPVDKPAGIQIIQRYLSSEPGKAIRIRIKDKKGFITIKGKSQGAARSEYEYQIPLKDAEELIQNFSGGLISKVRYNIHFGGKLWEVDEFHGDNEGLMVAEIELGSENERFDLPEWAGKEVTKDKRYHNAQLALNPYKNWEKNFKK